MKKKEIFCENGLNWPGIRDKSDQSFCDASSINSLRANARCYMQLHMVLTDYFQFLQLFSNMHEVVYILASFVVSGRKNK